MSSLKSSFSPIRLPSKGKTAAAADVNRIQDAIDAALKKLTADVQSALDKKKDK